MGMCSFVDGPAEDTNLTGVGEIRLIPDLSTKWQIPWYDQFFWPANHPRLYSNSNVSSDEFLFHLRVAFILLLKLYIDIVYLWSRLSLWRLLSVVPNYEP